MAVFQPPPTWAEVVLVDETTKRARFNPVWLKWFVDLIKILDEAGGGSIVHNATSGTQGGQVNELYHFTSAEHAFLAGFVVGTQALTITSTRLVTNLGNFSNGAAAGAGTLGNAPSAGNPSKWIPLVDNGVTRYIPTWT